MFHSVVFSIKSINSDEMYLGDVNSNYKPNKRTTKHGHKNSEEERSGLSSGAKLTMRPSCSILRPKCEVSTIWHI